jgi:flagellar motor switch protein FliG
MAEPEVAETEKSRADTESEEKFKALTGTEKSAILMMLLGEEEGAAVMKSLSPQEVQTLGAAMYSVQGVNQAIVNMVLDEFLDVIKQQTSLGLGAGNYIRNVMERALGEDKAQSVLSRITPSSSEKPIEILDWMDARSIAELIQDEHPQIVALVMSYLDVGLAADVLLLLEEDLQAEVIQRIATLETVDPSAIKELESVLQLKFKANTNLRSTQVGGVKAAAKIMNFTKEAMEKRILGTIRKNDKDLMAAIQDNMFVFDNLGMSDDKALQVLLRSVEVEDLCLAMKGADEELQNKLYSCMSERAAANLKDEMEALGPVRLSEVQEAQKRIVAVARRLSDEGAIVLAGRGGEEMV